MKQFLTTFLAVILAQLFLLVVVGVGTMLVAGVAMVGAGRGEATVPATATLVQEIPSSYLEYAPPLQLPLPKKTITHTMILENLEKARHDERIAAVVLKIHMPQIGYAKLGEIRQRVLQLRAAGTPVYAYADFVTQKTLYLAAACDSIFVSPGGTLWLTGLMSERYYLKDLAEHVGIDFQVSQIREYKSAAEMVLRSDMSPEVRENAEWLLEDIYGDLIAAVSQDRGVAHEEVEAWLETSMLDPDEATARGIIDGTLYWEALEDRLRGGAEEFASVAGVDYSTVPRARLGLSGPRIAVVHGQGMITSGKSGWASPLGVSMGDETMIAALEQALENERVQGVLLRLDTPGGLALASDRIGRMVARVAREKPVVISSVDLNASGGYMISYRCSTVVASPNSIVGSIGSIAARGSMAALTKKLGITWDRVTVGPHATVFSPVLPMTDEEFARFEAVHWEGYQDWVAGVAEHRGMTIAQVDGLARGRIFTGRQALGNGLIDDLGGFDEALALLKTQVGIAADEEVTFVHLPESKGLWEEITSGEWVAVTARLLLALGLRSEAQQRLAESITFWQVWIEADQPLALCTWRF